MWFTQPESLILLILATAAFVRGAFGFADALFAMPLLLLIIPATEASPLMALVACLIATVILIRERQAVEIRPAALLILSGLVGVPCGVYLTAFVNELIARSLLGVVIVSFSAWSLWKPNHFRLQTDRTAPVFGFAAGLLGGAYNTAGPPLVYFAALRRWSPNKFRATMQAYTLFGSSWVIAMHWLAGNMSPITFSRLFTAAPILVVATLFGQRFTAKLATERFIRWIYWLLILLGGGLVGTSLSW